MNGDSFQPSSAGPASPPEPVATESADLVEFQPLDPRAIKLWRMKQLITSAILLGLALAAVAIVGIAVPESLRWLAVGFVLLLVLRLWLFLWYPGRAYRAWGYRMNGKVLEIRHGIWFRVLTLLPLSRLQHVDLHRGPIERSMGLGSLILYTAGTQHSIIVIPGLDATEAARLRDHLVAVGGDDAV